MRFIGVDLAWGAPDDSDPNATGVVALDGNGRVLHASLTVGVEETATLIGTLERPEALAFIDAPLVVTNATGQRLCETQVGQRYWRWKVAANSTNLASPRLAGVALLRELQRCGWAYSDGVDGPPSGGRFVSECYPYTTIVGATALGYEDERPPYKRRPRGVSTREFREIRRRACDELIARVAGLRKADPPMDLASHPATAALIDEPSPLEDRAYKAREDLLDAALAAWTASFWARWGAFHVQPRARCPSQCEPFAT